MVEENKAALALARENMPQGKRVNYYALSDTAWGKTQEKGRSWGFMVLDPPRKGLSEAMRDFLAQSGPELLAYVSCDPATLARDSRFLLEGGYTLKGLTLYDFYPQTAHIESLALFGRRKQ
jgi:23S rRNA (uracil1939-C5)-methyltransferase